MSTEPTTTPINGLTSDSQTDDRERSFCTYPAPLDCSDLAETFRTDMTTAFHMVMTLTPAQLNLQALAYAACLNDLHGLDLDIDNILTGWRRGMEHAQHTA